MAKTEFRVPWKNGGSAKYVIWLDDEGHQFPMFVTDLVELVKTGIIRRGRVEGVWRPAKRGANYGVQFVRDAADDGLEGS